MKKKGVEGFELNVNPCWEDRISVNIKSDDLSEDRIYGLQERSTISKRPAYFRSVYTTVGFFCTPMFISGGIYVSRAQYINKNAEIDLFWVGILFYCIGTLIISIYGLHHFQIMMIESSKILLSDTKMLTRKNVYDSTGLSETVEYEYIESVVDIGWVMPVLLGKKSGALSPELLQDFIIADDGIYSWYSPRGKTFVPGLFAAVIFAGRLYFYRESLGDQIALYSGAVFYTYGSIILTYPIRNICFSFAIMCHQVGKVIKFKIGLWNRSNKQLAEMQRLAFYLNGFLAPALACFTVAAAFIASTSMFIGLASIAIFVLIWIVVSPIWETVGALSEKKAFLTKRVSKFMEAKNAELLNIYELSCSKEGNVKDKLEEMHAMKQQLIEFSKEIQEVNVYPDSVKLMQSIALSAMATIVPVLLVNLIS